MNPKKLMEEEKKQEEEEVSKDAEYDRDQGLNSVHLKML